MKRSMIQTVLLWCAAAALLLTAAGCEGGAQTEGGPAKDESLQRILDAGQLVLGLDDSYPPMGFADENGEIVGFDIDVAQEVCDRLGIALVKQPIDWDTKEDDLNSGRIDCIWNGMSVTPERAETMELSDPYMRNELIFVVPGGSDAKGVRDLKGKRTGVQAGSTAEEALDASELCADMTVMRFKDNIALLRELNKGTLDAVLLDSIVAYHVISVSEEQLFVLPDSLNEEEFAIGFRKGERELCNKIQETIGGMKADGTLGEISRKWFGSDITIVK